MCMPLFEIDLGTVRNSRNAFQAKARKLQSIYRAVFLMEKEGNGPEENDTPSGCMLVNGQSTGKNFLSYDIFKYALSRVDPKLKKEYEKIEEYRLFNNMLSSQPMAFNLFQPLMRYITTNTRIVQAIANLIPEANIARVANLQLEFIPENYAELNNGRTALDVLITYENTAGQPGLIGVEVKYTDALGLNVGTNAVLFPGAFIGSATAIQMNRNISLLLAYAQNQNIQNRYSIVLAPEGSDGKNDVDTARTVLAAHPELIRFCSLEKFVSDLKSELPQTGYFRTWINSFYSRYLDFNICDQF